MVQERWSSHKLRDYLAKKKRGDVPPRSKFVNKRTEVDGINFDSLFEAWCYVWLRDRVAKEPLARLYCQVPFALISLPAVDVRLRALRYTTDFGIWTPTAFAVIECKPNRKAAESRDAQLRMAAFQASYPDFIFKVWRSKADAKWPFRERGSDGN